MRHNGKRILPALGVIAAVLGVSNARAGGLTVDSSLVGKVRVSWQGNAWQGLSNVRMLGVGREEVSLILSRCEESDPVPFEVSLDYPLGEAVGRWHSGAGFDKSIPPTWRPLAKFSSSLAHDAPVVSYYDSASKNCLAIGCSEVLDVVRFVTGAEQSVAGLRYTARFLTAPREPMRSYAVKFLIDCRRNFYGDAIREAFSWCAVANGRGDLPKPCAAAFDPLYSFWYSYAKDVSEKVVERECAELRQYGLGTIIVDDGWQTDEYELGYRKCGDWKMCPAKFSDFRAHVDRVHAMGLRYLIWYSVPFVGPDSANFARFEGKFLCRRGSDGAAVLDPRFPEVREFLVRTYEDAMRNWDLDGLKLDFIDSFGFSGEDPAVAQNYAGRDIRSLPDAVDRLMMEVTNRLKSIRPDALVEFRQSYVGPAMLRYGNMFRAGDCALSATQNRVSTLDLRLSSEPQAVHSDMLYWSKNETPEAAALQILNVLFSVPQISVRLGELPDSHRRMLRGWLGFWREHRDTLMHGELRAMRPDLNYPIVYAYGRGEQVVAVYDPAQVVKVDPACGTAFIVNATPADSLVVEMPNGLRRLGIAPATFKRIEAGK